MLDVAATGDAATCSSRKILYGTTILSIGGLPIEYHNQQWYTTTVVLLYAMTRGVRVTEKSKLTLTKQKSHTTSVWIQETLLKSRLSPQTSPPPSPFSVPRCLIPVERPILHGKPPTVPCRSELAMLPLHLEQPPADGNWSLGTRWRVRAFLTLPGLQHTQRYRWMPPTESFGEIHRNVLPLMIGLLG